MQFLIDLDEEELATLGTALQQVGFVPETDIFAIDWKNPRQKKMVYQISQGSDLDKMVQEFNHRMEQSDKPLRLRDPDQLTIPMRYELLVMLNGNAEWDQDSALVETWYDDTPNLEEAATRRPHLFVS